MAHGEKRKFIRWDAIHLLDYVVLDPDGSKGRYSMGRTLDVSLNGLKLETSYELPLEDGVLMTTVRTTASPTSPCRGDATYRV